VNKGGNIMTGSQGLLDHRPTALARSPNNQNFH
jgi:hypothetical protein